MTSETVYDTTLAQDIDRALSICFHDPDPIRRAAARQTLIAAGYVATFIASA